MATKDAPSYDGMMVPTMATYGQTLMRVKRIKSSSILFRRSD